MTIGSGMPLWPISQKLQEARNISVIFILDLENIKMNNFLLYPSNLFEKSKLVLELILNSLCCICDGMKLLHWNALVGGLHFSCSYHHENYIVMLKSAFLWATFYDESVGMLDMHCLSGLLQIYVSYIVACVFVACVRIGKGGLGVAGYIITAHLTLCPPANTQFIMKNTEYTCSL